MAAGAAGDFRERPPGEVRVLVVGATGYIGKFVVRELVKRGYNVVAFARERSGIGGKQSAEDVRKELAGAGERAAASRALVLAILLLLRCGCHDRCSPTDVRFGDVMSLDSLKAVAFKDPVDVVVSCLASRTGDCWRGGRKALRQGRQHGAVNGGGAAPA